MDRSFALNRISRCLASTLLLVAACASFADRAHAQVTPTSVGGAAFVSESGRAVRLADYRGKVVFVNFWGAWCTPCMLEMQSIRGLQAALGGRSDIAFVFVSTRPESQPADTAWLRSRGIVGESVRLVSGSTAGMPVPSTFVLAPNGSVAQYRSSAVDWVTHADFIRDLLQHRAL